MFEAAERPFHGRGGSLGYCDVELWQSLRGATMIRRGAQIPRLRIKASFTRAKMLHRTIHAILLSPLFLPNFMALFRAKFGKHAGGKVLRVMEVAAVRGKITPLPQHEFAAKRVVEGRLLLVGDAAHMASPRTGAGAHTAVLEERANDTAFYSGITSPPLEP